MSRSIQTTHKIRLATPRASQVLIDYEYWLKRRYGVTGTYLVNSKCFLKTYRDGGDVLDQLSDYMDQKGPSLRSILRRFQTFLANKGYSQLTNDLHETRLPVSNLYVKLFLISAQDRLRSKGSLSTYSTVLNGYFDMIKDDPSRLNKRTAAKYVLDPSLSDYTKRLYKSILKAFCDWVITYQGIDAADLSVEQRRVKRMLRRISVQSLREVASLKVVLPRSLTSSYHKDSLSEAQRQRMLRIARKPQDKAVLSLMAWNGLRTLEVLRLSVADVKLQQRKISVWGKGKSQKSKDTIKLSLIAKREVETYIQRKKIKKGKLFPDLSRPALDSMVNSYFRKLKVKGKYSPHSLRHTAGQLMYERGVPLELIQKTLRHADMRTTMIYAQKAIDKNYFKRLRSF